MVDLKINLPERSPASLLLPGLIPTVEGLGVEAVFFLAFGVGAGGRDEQ